MPKPTVHSSRMLLMFLLLIQVIEAQHNGTISDDSLTSVPSLPGNRTGHGCSGGELTFLQTFPGQVVLLAIGVAFAGLVAVLSRPAGVLIGNCLEGERQERRRRLAAQGGFRGDVTDRVVRLLSLPVDIYLDRDSGPGQVLHDCIAEVVTSFTYHDYQSGREVIRLDAEGQGQLAECLSTVMQSFHVGGVPIYQAPNMMRSTGVLSHGMLEVSETRRQLLSSMVSALLADGAIGLAAWGFALKQYFAQPQYVPHHGLERSVIARYIPLSAYCGDGPWSARTAGTFVGKSAAEKELVHFDGRSGSGSGRGGGATDHSSDSSSGSRESSVDTAAKQHKYATPPRPPRPHGIEDAATPEAEVPSHPLLLGQVFEGPASRQLFYGIKRGTGLSTYARFLLHSWANQAEHSAGAPLLVVYITQAELIALSREAEITEQRIWEHVLHKEPGSLDALSMALGERNERVMYLLDDIVPRNRVDLDEDAESQVRFVRGMNRLFSLPNIKVFSHYGHFAEYEPSVVFTVVGFDQAASSPTPQEIFARDFFHRDGLELSAALRQVLLPSSLTCNPAFLEQLCMFHQRYPRVPASEIRESVLLQYCLNQRCILPGADMHEEAQLHHALGSLAMHDVLRHRNDWTIAGLTRVLRRYLPERPHYRDIEMHIQNNAIFRQVLLSDRPVSSYQFSSKVWRDFLAGYYLAHTEEDAFTEAEPAFLDAYATQTGHPVYGFYVYWLTHSEQHDRAYAFVRNCQAMLGSRLFKSMRSECFSDKAVDWLRLLSELDPDADPDAWAEFLRNPDIWYAAAYGGQIKILAAYLRDSRWDPGVKLEGVEIDAVEFAERGQQMVALQWLQASVPGLRRHSPAAAPSSASAAPEAAGALGTRSRPALLLASHHRSSAAVHPSAGTVEEGGGALRPEGE